MFYIDRTQHLVQDLVMASRQTPFTPKLHLLQTDLQLYLGILVDILYKRAN